MTTGTSSMSRFAIAFLALFFALPAAAQIKCSEGMEPLERDAESRMSARDFIKEVATNEVVFSKAFASYGYKLEVNVQTLAGDTVDGEYRRTSTIDFDAHGRRPETGTGGPGNTPTGVKRVDHDLEPPRAARP